MLKELFTLENIIFILIMGGLSIRSAIKSLKCPKEEDILPSVVAAVGIIGTFLGIFLGLLHFDTANLEGSIPLLLGGMKTAFLTSLLGLILSNGLKIFKSHNVTKSDNTMDDASLKTIAELMLDMKKSMDEMRESQEQSANLNKESMEKLIQSLVGDGETTLTNQMVLLRTGMMDAQRDAQSRLNEGLDNMGAKLGDLVESNNAISGEIKRGNNELIEEFRSFAKNMAENNMKVFIEAIEKCIKDLNNQLKEQFGENFKQLNLAVEKLLEWQIHYKETVEKTNTTQVELYKGMEEAKNLVTNIMEKTDSIVDVASRLGDKLVTFDTQEKTLNNSIEILNKVSSEAVDLLPNLDIYINKYYDDSEKALTNITEINEKMSTELKTSLKSVHQNIETSVISSDEKIRKASISSTERITEHLVKTTREGIEKVNEASTNVLEAVHKTHESATKEIMNLSDIVDKKTYASIENMEIITNTLETNYNKVMKKIKDTTVIIEDHMTKNAENMDDSRSEILALTKVATENITTQQKEIISNIKSITREVLSTSEISISAIEKQIKGIDTAISKLENEGFTITERVSKSIEAMVENNNTNLQTSVTNLNTQLSSTLNTSLESLGRQLANVSEKFVNDYTPLTEKLKNVVEISRRLG